MADLFSAATGQKLTEDEILFAGRRIVTMEKCFNVMRGASRKDDTLPWRLMNEPTPDRPDSPNAVNSKWELDKMLDEYYTLHGWEVNSSWPTRENLEMLGLGEFIVKLEAMGKLDR